MALDKHDEEEKTTRPTSKIIILISDGEDFSESAQDAAEKVKNAGIRLFTLGIGTARGSTIPVGRQLKKDNKGNGGRKFRNNVW